MRLTGPLDADPTPHVIGEQYGLSARQTAPRWKATRLRVY
ncbi:hypothetical protein BN903_85 [Halorubrum sp. AJ67]|nr:hypothetical protein BN903_85 [Halorubrum sp. AJ67]